MKSSRIMFVLAILACLAASCRSAPRCPVSPRSGISDPYERTKDAASLGNAGIAELRPSSDKKATKRAESCAKDAMEALPREKKAAEMRADDRVRLRMLRTQIEFVLWAARNWHMRDPSSPKRRAALDRKWAELEQFPTILEEIVVQERNDRIRVFDVMYEGMTAVDRMDQDNIAQFNRFYELAREALTDSPFQFPNLLMLLDAHAGAVKKGIHGRDRLGALNECSKVLQYPYTDADRRAAVYSAIDTCDSILEGEGTLLSKWQDMREQSPDWKPRTQESTVPKEQ